MFGIFYISLTECSCKDITTMKKCTQTRNVLNKPPNIIVIVLHINCIEVLWTKNKLIQSVLNLGHLTPETNKYVVTLHMRGYGVCWVSTMYFHISKGALIPIAPGARVPTCLPHTYTTINIVNVNSDKNWRRICMLSFLFVSITHAIVIWKPTL